MKLGTLGTNNALVVMNCMQIEDNQPLHFTQVFQLVAHQPGQYYIHNDLFRLLYG